MKALFLIMLLFSAVVLTACSDLLIINAGGTGGSAQEYSNLYIAGDAGDISALNISGVPVEIYEVHID